MNVVPMYLLSYVLFLNQSYGAAIVPIGICLHSYVSCLMFYAFQLIRSDLCLLPYFSYLMSSALYLLLSVFCFMSSALYVLQTTNYNSTNNLTPKAYLMMCSEMCIYNISLENKIW